MALRIICDREEEIDAFIPEEYWTLTASFAIKGEKKPLVAKYYGEGDKKASISSKEELEAVKASLAGAVYRVADVKRGERTKKAPLPFTTSTLQQEASKVLNFSTQKTMRLAQQLYEGVEIKGEGTIGLITYLRTDSTRVSEEAERMAKEYIEKTYGAEYAGEGTDRKAGQKIQDAHEAIRPTRISLTPQEVKTQLPRDLFRLYQLIWKRFTASRMQPVKIGGNGHIFTVAASRLYFDGFMSVYTQEEERETEENLSVELDKDTLLTHTGFEEKQHFTQPPAHFTEASLVHALEELGIGRPSTYAPTITTILGRRYVISCQQHDERSFSDDCGCQLYRQFGSAFGRCGRGRHQLENRSDKFLSRFGRGGAGGGEGAFRSGNSRRRIRRGL